MRLDFTTLAAAQTLLDTGSVSSLTLNEYAAEILAANMQDEVEDGVEAEVQNVQPMANQLQM